MEPLSLEEVRALSPEARNELADLFGECGTDGAIATQARLCYVVVEGGGEPKPLAERMRCLLTRVSALARAGWLETQVPKLLALEPKRCRDYWQALVESDGAEFAWKQRTPGEAIGNAVGALAAYCELPVRGKGMHKVLRERFYPRAKKARPVVSSVEKDAPAPALDVQDANGLVAAVVAEIRKSLLPRPALLGAVLVELLSDGADIAAALRPVVKKWNFGDPNTGGGLAESKELMLGLMRAIGEYGQVQGASSALAGAAVAYGEALGNASHATAARESYQIAGVIAENLRPFLPRTAPRGKAATVADVAAQQIDSAQRAALVAECVSAVA